MKPCVPERGSSTPTLSFAPWARTMPNGCRADAAAVAASALLNWRRLIPWGMASPDGLLPALSLQTPFS